MLRCEPITTLVERFGWARVYEAGFHVFGFPAFWDPSLKQVLDLKSFLEQQHVV
ncbi:hypothetical protein Pan14r_51930 [Crateriforma conspicua]|uniref:Uncharacterized protein n=1 Tax=Crateriforma conspicua TaxID=2527996 RepID=A0A5C5XR00_9PLAN|nr:hypothetical protein Pan14r_51930 [Crateriforma conspicua]